MKEDPMDKVYHVAMVVLAIFVAAILFRATMFPDLVDLPEPAGQPHCFTDYECEHSGYVAEGWIEGFEFVGATRGDVSSWAK